MNEQQRETLKELGSTDVKGKHGSIHCLTIAGLIEGHQPAPDEGKGTKYEHVLPMLAAVEEMLLGSYNGIIRIFPAIPDGKPNYTDFHRYGYPIQEEGARLKEYAAWRDVSFDKLLAKGAFEVSASLANGKLSYIRLYSKKGGIARLTSPFLKEEYHVYAEENLHPAIWKNGILEIARQQTKEEPKYPTELLVKSKSIAEFCLHPDVIRAILTKSEYTLSDAKLAIRKYINSFN